MYVCMYVCMWIYIAQPLQPKQSQGCHVQSLRILFQNRVACCVVHLLWSVMLHYICVFVKLKVLPKDLQLCTDMATGVDSMGQFSFGDLVQLESVHVCLCMSVRCHLEISK